MRALLVVGSASVAISVLFGAFGAHILKSRLSTEDLTIFDKDLDPGSTPSNEFPGDEASNAVLPNRHHFYEITQHYRSSLVQVSC